MFIINLLSKNFGFVPVCNKLPSNNKKFPLIGVIPEDECVIVSTNRGEPLVLENKLSLPGLAFEHTACRLDGQDIEFLDLQLYSKGPLKRLRRFFLCSFIS